MGTENAIDRIIDCFRVLALIMQIKKRENANTGIQKKIMDSKASELKKPKTANKEQNNNNLVL